MREPVALAATVVGALTCACALTCAVGCDVPRFNCASDDECGEGEACVEGVCALASTTKPPGPCDTSARTLVVALGDDAGHAVCVADVSARDDAGALHALEATTDAGACVFAADALLGHVTIAVHAFNFAAAVQARDVALDDACAPTHVALTLTPVANACDGDAVCQAGDACAIDAAGDAATCATTTPQQGSAGAPCASDDECASARCTADVCSALCTADADCGKRYLACVPVAALLGHGACVVRDDLADVACTSNADCAATDRVCGLIENGALACELPPGRLDDDATCTADNACADGLCDDAVDGRCTRACASDADCAANSVQTTCTSIAVEGVSASACFQACARLSDCADEPQRTCRGRVDVVKDAVVFACDGPFGSAPVGTQVTTGDECATHFAVTDASGKTKCSAPCESDNDCPFGGSCKQIALTTPSGAQQLVKACSF